MVAVAGCGQPQPKTSGLFDADCTASVQLRQQRQHRRSKGSLHDQDSQDTLIIYLLRLPYPMAHARTFLGKVALMARRGNSDRRTKASSEDEDEMDAADVRPSLQQSAHTCATWRHAECPCCRLVGQTAARAG